MVKIGKSSGGSSPADSGVGPPGVPRDPFSGLERSLLGDDGVPRGHSWGVFTRAATAGIARSWFQHLATVPLPEWVATHAPTQWMPGHEFTNPTFPTEQVEARVSQLSWYADGVVFPDLVRESSDLGTLTLFSKSTLAPKVLKYFSDQGVSGEEIPILGLGSNIAEIGETTMWLGPWGTEFGTRANIWCEIRTGEDGAESAYFQTNLAVATRAPAVWLAEVFSVPAQVHGLLYTAETKLPSSIMTMSRSLAWPDVPEDLIPTPFVTFERSGLCCVNLGDAGNDKVQMDFAGYPVVLTAGYLVPESQDNHFEHILPVVINTLTNLVSIVEDGFRNYRNADTPVPFDHVLGSEYVFFEDEDDVIEGESTGGHGRWVPETLLGHLVRASRETYVAAYPMDSGDEQRRLFQWVAHEGAGAVVASAINSLVYSYLMHAREFDYAEWLLKKAIAMEVFNESPNAQANLGQVYLAQGKRNEAREVFEQAASQEFDKFAVSEASYFLGSMAAEDGDPEQARAHYTRGATQGLDDGHKKMCQEKLNVEFS